MHPEEPTFLVDLDVRGRTCLVVGRGFSANRRAAALAACGADVTVVSTHGYERGMASRFDVVVTCDRRVDDQVVHDARTGGALLHVVGDPDRSNVLLPRLHLRQLAS